MSIDVREVDDQPDIWDRCVERSPQSTIFHNLEFLELMEEFSGMELRKVVGFKGQEPIGGMAVYVSSKGPAQIVYSPPSGGCSAYLGPFLLNVEKLKRRKQERRHKQFIRTFLSWLDEEIAPKHLHIRTTVGYDDPRPFQWSDCTVSPRYTYGVNLTLGIDEIKSSFSKSLRRYLVPDSESSFEITVGGHEAIEFVQEQIAARYDAQGKNYPLTSEFLTDAYDTLPEGAVSPYIGKVDGEPTSGIIVLRDDTTQYFWQGGGKPDTEFPINDVLHWRIIRDGLDEELEWYDLYGANTERICKYKSKFNPELRESYEITRESTLSKIYKTVL